MSSEEIIRIAAKGDGVTASGRFAWGAAPGDLLLEDGTLEWGPHHIAPVCKHFGQQSSGWNFPLVNHLLDLALNLVGSCSALKRLI